MPGVSGIQLCRLIRSEAATCDVPFILRGASDDRRDRFCAERAGAVAYVARGRLSELVRALDKAVSVRKPEDEFFMQLAEGQLDIRDRTARHLDRALFESVIASEIRALATSDSDPRTSGTDAERGPDVGDLGIPEDPAGSFDHLLILVLSGPADDGPLAAPNALA